MKHLIVCADGTWNTPDQEDNGIPTPTNVVRIRSCIADQARITVAGKKKTLEQRSYYHPGVGTEGGMLEKTAGGVWGQGLSKNIQSAYHWLARNYAPGDALFLFGFSRGAYTVRSLGGLLNKCGLLDLTGIDAPEGWKRVEAAYQQGYRESLARSQWAKNWAFHHNKQAPVRFIGVWDTVGALGIPDDLALLNLLDRPRNWRFHDTTLGDNVEIARHAVALDEMRASFTPTLWTKHATQTDLKQVWFPGVHCDVGGGYAETGLADGALHWMIGEAKAAGLAFNAGLVKQIKADPLGVLHDSMKGIFKAHRSRPRNTPALGSPGGDLHESANQRHKTPPIAQAPYRPTRTLAAGKRVTLTIYAREHWNHTGIYLLPGKYRFKAEGEWLDSSIPCGPGGTADGDFHIGEVAHVIGTGLGWLEQGWKRVMNQEGADFKMTRRHEEWPWFSLIGVVANSDRKPTSDGTPPAHQNFLIGTGKKLNLKRGGYLYAYANDAWDFYGNNRGSVQLSVERISSGS